MLRLYDQPVSYHQNLPFYNQSKVSTQVSMGTTKQMNESRCPFENI